MQAILEKVLTAYGINNNAAITPFGHGLINNTWKIEDGNNSFILQKINTEIFKQPEFIAENIRSIAGYLSVNHPGYFFVTPYQTLSGKDLLYIEGNSYYRMFPFIQNSHTINVAKNTGQTFEAAKKFGELTRLLSAYQVNKLKITLPDFHNILLRYNDFEKAIQSGLKERIEQAGELIQFLQGQKKIVEEFERIKCSPNFKLRVTHHDTKINNVLLDKNEKGICVIDLDTLMPGYFFSDVGDMIRTYISPVDEEEKELSKIDIREDYFVSLAKGYLSEMTNELSKQEIEHFVFAGKFMIYMQALRFLTDYLNNDIYYGNAYKGQNFYRAANQSQLLKLLIEKEEHLSSVVAEISHRI